MFEIILCLIQNLQNSISNINDVEIATKNLYKIIIKYYTKP